jgi:hypothetical protein
VSRHRRRTVDRRRWSRQARRGYGPSDGVAQSVGGLVYLQHVRITPARQRNAVSEGMALGLLMAGRDVLPYDKVRVDLAFEGAWRGWAFRGRFPQVSTDLRNGSDGVHVMTRADEQKHVWHLFWEREGRDLRIVARSQWEGEAIEPDAVADSLDGDVAPAGWLALAEGFLERFER